LTFKERCYDVLGDLGEALVRLMPWIDSGLELSGSKTHPAVYASTLLLAASLSAATCIPLAIMLIYQQPLLAVLMAFMPALVLLAGSTIPRLNAQSMLYKFSLELPYAAAYLATMAASGLPLSKTLFRLRKAKKLFPAISVYSSRVVALAFTRGLTVVEALEKFSGTLGIKEFKDLVYGYSSTLRSGGDVAGFLERKAELMFQEMLSKVKVVSERLALLMEAYLSVMTLGSIGMYLLFTVSLSMSDALGVSVPPEAFFLFSFAAIPGLSALFIYLADASQIGYPEPVFYRYLPFIAVLPFTVVTTLMLVIPLVFQIPVPIHPAVLQLRELVKHFLGNPGYTPAIILSIIVMVSVAPAAVYDLLCSREANGYIKGLAGFLRDLVEIRKSELPLEKCIKALSKRDYGLFSKVVQRVNRGLGWGLPIRRVYWDVIRSVKSWLVAVNLFLLLDTLEVGGGTVETLETMARFSELSLLVEKERRSALRPLVLMPYFGMMILVVTAISFLKFMNEAFSITGASLPMVTLVSMLTTPLPLQALLLGLTAGKISSGRISGGFIHALLLAGAVLLALLVSPMLKIGLTGVVAP